MKNAFNFASLSISQSGMNLPTKRFSQSIKNFSNGGMLEVNTIAVKEVRAEEQQKVGKQTLCGYVYCGSYVNFRPPLM